MTDREMQRREFLAKMAAMAGGVGAAGMLPTPFLLDRAAKTQRVSPTALTDRPLEHIVILMMENRSFDHYFGWLPNANADNSKSYTDPAGTSHDTFHFSQLPGGAGHQGCGYDDPGHGWESGRAQLLRGFMGQGSGNDIFALTYFGEGDLGFIHAAAKAYTVYDNYFCSMLGPTWPNRYYKWSATSNGRKNNEPPFQTLGNQWPTIFDVATAAGLSVGYYASDLPFSAVWGPRAIPWTRPAAAYYADAAAGTLPNITIIDPPFRDGGGFDGNSADEHPHGDVRLGQAFMSDVAHAFMSSPCYRRGAMFIIYDEWGGFFDSVTPPRVPDDRANATNLYEDFGQLGFRTPTVVISPWTRNHTGQVARVSSGLYAHESILRLAANRFGLPTINGARHANANDIGDSFQWDTPDFEVPDLPDPVHIVSRPCALGGGDILSSESAATHAGDLDDLEMLADRLKFPTYESKPQQLFQLPDSVVRAYRPPGL